MKEFDLWFCVFLSWASASFFGDQKTRYIYGALTENSFVGDYLLIAIKVLSSTFYNKLLGCFEQNIQTRR